MFERITEFVCISLGYRRAVFTYSCNHRRLWSVYNAGGQQSEAKSIVSARICQHLAPLGSLLEGKEDGVQGLMRQPVFKEGCNFLEFFRIRGDWNQSEQDI